MPTISIVHLLRRAPAVCTLPPLSTHLALHIQSSLSLGLVSSSLPLAALKEIMQRPGVLATPRDLSAWVDITVLHGPALRFELEEFASSNTPCSSDAACCLLASCASLRASKGAVEYLARHVGRNNVASTLTAPLCVMAICGLAACKHPLTDPVYASLIAKIKEMENAACDIRLVEASHYCLALRPLLLRNLEFLAKVAQDLRAGGVYTPPRAAAILLGLRFLVVKGNTVRELCNAVWQSHSVSMLPKDLFKLILAGGDLDEMRRSLSERSAEYLKVERACDIYHIVVRRRWNVGASLQLALEAALMPTVAHKYRGALIEMLTRQVTLKRFGVPLTDALVKALGPKRIPVEFACSVLRLSSSEAAMVHLRPFYDAVLSARYNAFRDVTSLQAFSHLLQTLVTIRHRGYPDAPVGDALTATAAWVVASQSMPIVGTEMVARLLRSKSLLTPTEWKTLWHTILQPMYRRVLEGLSSTTASCRYAVFAFLLAPARDISRIGHRLVALTGDDAIAFRNIPSRNVVRLARKAALALPSAVDAAHLNRHFTHWCRNRHRHKLTPSQSVDAVCILTLAPRMSPSALRQMLVNVRSMVTFLNAGHVTRVLISMARCRCVDLALIDGLMVCAVARLAPSWHDDDIAPAILAMAHLRVVCVPVVEALVRRLRTFPVGVQRRHAPKVVEALAALIA